jgi:hypothetical protein
MNVFQILKVLRDQRGGQTLEWIAVAAFIMAIGALVYGGANGTITTALQTAAGTIAGNLATMSGS